MVVFLAGRKHVRIGQLHRRIKNRLQSDGRFETVRLRVAEPREPGPYRVVAGTDPRMLLDDYPASAARIEVGFSVPGHVDHEFYWFNWIEPDRNFLLGWHRDDDHGDLGPVHLQVNQDGSPVDRERAQLLDEHPMAVLEARLTQLPEVLAGVQWTDGTVVGIDR